VNANVHISVECQQTYNLRQNHVDQHILEQSLIGGPVVILTSDSKLELEHPHGISIGETFGIMRISKEGLRQLLKTERAYEKKLNSFQVNL
jgi:hypothetical protein